MHEFVAFHHGRRGGLDGPVGEVSFVVVVVVEVDGVASGVVRLQHAGAGNLEVGMWLTRSVRGRGIGGQVLADVARRAVALCAGKLVADTTAVNEAALAALTRIGADVGQPTPNGVLFLTTRLRCAGREWHSCDTLRSWLRSR